MLHLVAVFVLAMLGASGASAQERGWLAIGLESARHAFSFSGSADAVNACGMSDCEVVETFTACLAVAYSSETVSGRPVWTWIEAATEGDARKGAQDECEAAGGLRCAVENTYCLNGGSATTRQATPPATAEQETVFWQSIVDSTNPAMFEAYIAQFPNGVFRALAEARLAELRASPDQRPGATRSPASGASAAVGRDPAATAPDPASGIPRRPTVHPTVRRRLLLDGGVRPTRMLCLESESSAGRNRVVDGRVRAWPRPRNGNAQMGLGGGVADE